MVGRIPIANVTPVIDATLGSAAPLPAKATLGEPMPVTATVFREGHDKLGAEVVPIDPAGKRRAPVRMRLHPTEPDLYRATVTPDLEGAWAYEVHSWSDPLATWQHAAGLKIPAGVDVELMFTEGALLFERALKSMPKGTKRSPEAKIIKAAITAAKDTKRPVEARLAALQDPDLVAALRTYPLRDLLTTAGPFPFYADRPRALFGSWYEFFPRSEGAVLNADGTVTSGSFKTAIQRLDAVAKMGFDVLYLPPIHPIGEVNRKGPNNQPSTSTVEDPAPADWVGSPWAIGSAFGGHDAIHPDLGTFEDFKKFVQRARELDIEVALDLALQAAPDHPWAKEHPEWFTTRADGTIAYAENPPKKYQDIYPVNFDNDPDGIYAEVLRIVKMWMSLGVRIFRVDNPHTKPVAFWEWLLGEIRKTDPDVLFLAEAFTKPAMMSTLGAIGYHQSYTYFTWRTEKGEIEQYLHEVSHQTSDRMRPNFFVNTPDILHEFLQYGGPAAFKIRAVLAALSSPSWGVYAGFELGEHVAVKPGSEEYLDSEKYQIRIRDWAKHDTEGTTLAPYLTRLNEIRRTHPALQLLRNLTIHRTDDDHVLCFSKSTSVADGTDTVIVVLNLDPHGTRETQVHLDMPALGMGWDDRFVVEDLLTGEVWPWGEHNYVRLDPRAEPAHILHVRSTS